MTVTHIVAIAALIKNAEKTKVLVLKRQKNEKFFAGKWHFPGGKVERGESFLEALKREVKEEAGLEIYDEIRHIRDFHFIRKDGNHVVGITFEVTAKPGRIILNQDNDEYRWISPEEIHNLDYIHGIEKDIEIGFK